MGASILLPQSFIREPHGILKHTCIVRYVQSNLVYPTLQKRHISSFSSGYVLLPFAVNVKTGSGGVWIYRQSISSQPFIAINQRRE